MQFTKVSLGLFSENLLKSFEVMTAFTPSNFSASDVSIEIIFACGCGDLKILA